MKKRIGVILALSLALSVIVVATAPLSRGTTNAGSSLSLSPQEENHLLWSYQTGADVRPVSISSDGSYIAAGSDDNKVYLFSHTSSTPLWTYTTSSRVRSVSISSDGNYIAAGSEDLRVYFFSRTSSTPLWSYKTTGGVCSVAISSDGNYIAAGNWAAENYPDPYSMSEGYWGEVYLFSSTSSTPLWTYTTSNYGYVRSVSISSDGNYIAAGGGDNKVHLL